MTVRIMIIITLAAAGLGSSAAGADAARWAPRLGLEVLGLEARLTHEADSGGLVNDPGFRPGWGVGTTARWERTPGLSAVSGLRYRETGGRLVSTFSISSGSTIDVFTSTWRDSWRWLELPLHARWSPARTLPLYLEAGPDVRYLLQARHRSDLIVHTTAAVPFSPGRVQDALMANIFEDIGRDGLWYDNTSDFRRVDVGLSAGAGMAWKVRGHTASLHAIYTHGLPDLRLYPEFTRRSRTLEAGLGLEW